MEAATEAATEARNALISFHDLYQHLESTRLSLLPDTLEGLLTQRLPQLRDCGGAPFGTRTEASRRALDTDNTVRWGGVSLLVDSVQRELSLAISDRYDVDEIAALFLVRTFLESEHRSLDALARARAPRTDAYNDFLDAFNVFFFEEQLAVIRCTSALLRISEDAQNMLHPMATALLDAYADAAWAGTCLAWFEAATTRQLPAAVRHDARYSLLWARHGLQEQLALLEVVFLLYYGRLTPQTAVLAHTLQTIARTHFGERQAATGFLDASASALVDSVRHLLMFIAIECLNLEAALDDDDGSSAGPIAAAAAHDPDALETAFQLLDGAALTAYAPLLLGWSLVVRCLEAWVDTPAPDDAAGRARVAATLAVHDGGPPVSHRLVQAATEPSMRLFAGLAELAESPLLHSGADAALGTSNLSALAYRAVFKGLLLTLTDLVQPEYLADFDALVALWVAAFSGGGRDGASSYTLAPSSDARNGIAALCLQFWTVDYVHPTRASTLETARHRFPASFLPLVRLTRALSGGSGVGSGGAGDGCAGELVTADGGAADLGSGWRPPVAQPAAAAAAHVFEYLAALPTLALLLPPGLPCWELDPGGDAGVVRYTLTHTLSVPTTQLSLPVGTRGTLISPLECAPAVVLWSLEQPLSAWLIMRDLLAAYVAPRGKRRADTLWDASVPPTEALSPDCAADEWDLVADILELFVAVLRGGADGVADALLEHLDEGDPRAPPAPRLVAIALDVLQIVLAAPVHTRVACAAYALLQLLLPRQTNEVWQHVRSTNVLVGSAGTAPLRADADDLPSALLAHALADRTYAGVLRLLDLTAALVHERACAQFADARELHDVKTAVLCRALRWAADTVWAEHVGWPYAHVSDRLQVSARCVRLFTLVLADPCARTEHDAVAALVFSVLVAGPSPMYAPLLATISAGAALVQQLDRDGHAADARLAEEVVEAHLRLALLLVECAPDGPLLPALLGAAHGGPCASRGAGAVLQYVGGGAPPFLACTGAHLLTSACRVTEAGSFRLAGQSGSTHDVESAVSSLLGVVTNTHEDVPLRVAVWLLLSALVDSQPALATLLLTGGHLAQGPASLAASADGAQRLDQTALQLAADAVAVWEELWMDAPALLEAAVHFLTVAWAHALEHPHVFADLQCDTGLWRALGALVQRGDAHAGGVASLDAADDTTPHDAAVLTAAAFRRMCQARALRLFEIDVQCAPRVPPPASLRVLQDMLTAGGMGRALVTLLRTAPGAVRPSVAEAHLAALVPRIPLLALRRAPRRDDFDFQRTFGASYAFYTGALSDKLAGVLRDDADALDDAVALALAVNLDWGLVDAGAACAHAWTRCISVSAGRLLSDAEASRSDAAAAMQQAWADAAQQLAHLALDASPDTAPANDALANHVALLAALVTAAWAPRGSTAPAHVETLLPLLAALFEHSAYALADSLAGTRTPPYHTPLLQMALLCLASARRARAGASFGASLDVVVGAVVRVLRDLAPFRARLSDAASDDARGAEVDLELVVAVVQTAMHMDIATHVWLAPLRDARALPACVELISAAPLVVLGPAAAASRATPRTPPMLAHVRFFAPLLRLFSALAANADACELVAQAGAVFGLCSNALSDRLDRGALEPVLASGDANPLHALWILVLQCVINLVEGLGSGPAQPPAVAAHFVDTDVATFVDLYAPQLRRSLAFAPFPAPLGARTGIDVAQLQELVLVLRLFYAMHRAKAPPVSVPTDSPAQRAAHVPHGAVLLAHAPGLLQQLTYLQQHPLEMRVLLGVDELLPPDADAIAAVAGEAVREAGVALLALLWDLSGTDAVLTRDPGDWPTLPAVIIPTLHVAPASPASLGTLLELASVLADAVRSAPKSPIRDALEAALEQCIGLCATQAVVWARGRVPSDAPEDRRAHVASAQTEIDAGLGRDVDAALRVAQDVCGGTGAGVKAAGLWRVFHAFARQYLSVGPH
ncbi:hypothetical protein MSPP1_002177 [Malassezia sp. CBS 17886]|nr:hypothetical protein MSPP1_002177 [Malassezia sp. CBS 17886]